MLPAGVYLYVIELFIGGESGDRQSRLAGDVTIIR